MKVLVVYQLHEKTDRNTISEHLKSFKRYSKHSFHYLNVFETIPDFVIKIKYDAVLFHYTFLAGDRFQEDDSGWERKTQKCGLISGYKIALPQDEYDHTDRLRRFILNCNISELYTCFQSEADIISAYGEEVLKKVKISKTYTGFVDERTVEVYAGKTKKLKDRNIDFGYRARKLPPYFGKHGQLKYELVLLFEKVLKDTDWVYDITNTNKVYETEDATAVKHGSDWLNFLSECKAFIGCEGGSSLLDRDGSIQQAVKYYLGNYPEATFEEVEKECFEGLDYNIHCFALSPRHFECATTKTLQILVEGEYGGVFKPNIHYIPIKKDLSNISDVINKLSDAAFCQRIVDNAYIDIILRDQFTYKSFVQSVFQDFSRPKWYSHFNFMFKIKGLIFEFRNPYLRFLHKLNVFYSDNKYYLYRRFVLPNPLLRQVLSFIKDLLTFEICRR